MHISLLGCLLPDGLVHWDHCLLRHCDFSLDLKLATLDEVQSITAGLAYVIDDLIGQESLRVQDSTHVLDQMVGHSCNEWDRRDEFLPVDLSLLFLEEKDLGEVLALEVQCHATFRAYHVEWAVNKS